MSDTPLFRWPQEKLDQGLKPVCGRCKTPLPVSSKPVPDLRREQSSEGH